MSRVAATFKIVIHEIIYATNVKLNKLSYSENANLTHADLNTSTEKLENRCNIHLVSFDTLTSRAKRFSNGQLLYYLWSFGIFDEYHPYKT